MENRKPDQHRIDLADDGAWACDFECLDEGKENEPALFVITHIYLENGTASGVDQGACEKCARKWAKKCEDCTKFINESHRLVRH